LTGPLVRRHGGGMSDDVERMIAQFEAALRGRPDPG
jgi:hypothetical protein